MVYEDLACFDNYGVCIILNKVVDGFSSQISLRQLLDEYERQVCWSGLN